MLETIASSATDSEISCRITQTLLLYVREQNNASIGDLLEGLELDEPYLSDPDNWVSHAFLQVLYDRMIAVLDDENAVYQMALASLRFHTLGFLERISSLLGSPGLVYSRAPGLNKFLKLNGSVYVREMGKRWALIEDRYHDTRQKTRCDCDYTRGILAGIPTMFGLPPAQVEEIQCQVNAGAYGTRKWPDHPAYGCNGCVYRVSWAGSGKPSFWQRLFPGSAVYRQVVQDLLDANQKIHKNFEMTRKLARDLKEANATLERQKRALEVSENKYRVLAENAADFIWILDLETMRFSYASPSAYNVWGFTPQEVENMPLSRVLAPASFEAVTELHAQELKRDGQEGVDPNRTLTITVEHICKDGAFAWAETTVRFLRDDAGKPLGVLGISRNIDERKQMERIDRVIRQETELDRMLDGVITEVASIFNCDRAWLLYPCDPDASHFTIPIARTHPEYPGLKHPNRPVSMTPSTAEECRQALAADGPVTHGSGNNHPVSSYTLQHYAVRSQMFMALYPKIGSPWLFGIHQCDKNRWWSIEERNLFNDIGRRLSDGLGSMLFFRDLRDSEEKFRAITASAHDAIVMMDRDGKISYWNAAAEKIFGYASDQILGRDLHKTLAAPKSFASFRAAFSAFSDTGNNGTAVGKTIELEAMHQSGRTFPAELSVSSVKLAGQWHAVGIVRDISERKKTEATQRQLERQFFKAQKNEIAGKLAGGIAHDFNNLLMGIQGHISLMLMDTHPIHPNYAHLKGVEEHVESASDLTRQLMGFSRGGKYEVAPTELNDLLKKNADMFGRTRKEIRIHIKPAETVWTVEVDQNQIGQVLLNLFVNAWQSMPAGGDLFLETANVHLDAAHFPNLNIPSGRYVRVSVTDTGLGMDERTKEHIFEPFFTTKKSGQGTGLGLASADGIVRNHGGIIRVYSEKGMGTAFHIYLPASEKAVERLSDPKQGIAHGTETILLVDDESIITDVSSKMLETMGYRVWVAHNGEQAVERFRAEKDAIDLVILDMVMPGMGGGAAFDRLRAIDPEVKVLLASGYSINGQAQSIMERGCNGFIQKPFNMAELSHKVREILSGPPANDPPD